MTDEAKHLDAGKVPLDSLPFEAVCHVGRVIRYGEKKYGMDNWAKGMAWRKLLGSTLRHIVAWAMGEDRDEESGEYHLAHACTDILFLLTYQLEGRGTDNRRKTWEVVEQPNDVQLMSPVVPKTYSPLPNSQGVPEVCP